VQGDPELLAIPVVVPAASQDPADIEHCYALYANASIVKPVGFDGFAPGDPADRHVLP
jgi:hypothetical protein